MSSVLTFVIPVRHPDNTKDWSSLKAKLRQTIASISAQSDPNWRAVIAANKSADLPPLPDKFQVVHVDFPPNPYYEFSGGDKEAFWESIRIDKGRRVLAGMLAVRDSEFFMIVDDDDFIHKDIVAYVARHRDQDGWRIKKGYLWAEGANVLVTHEDFCGICGTCFVIRSSHYQLPESFETADEEYVKAMLGSHKKIDKILTDRGVHLADLPFRGAIYRIGQAESVTRCTISSFMDRSQFRRPVSALKQLSKLRLLTPGLRREFFGHA